jgi:uncharacterized protein
MLQREVDFGGRLPVEGYGPGFFRIAGAVHSGPVALLPEGPRPWAGLGDLAPFVAETRGFDLLIVGLGAEVGVLPREVRAALEAAGLGVETMATPPACRTYNVLLAEDRRVAAALIPV